MQLHIFWEVLQDRNFIKTANLLVADEYCHEVNQEASAAFYILG